MNEGDTNGEKRVATSIGLYVLRSTNTLFALIAAVGVLWIKANVPSREQFDALTLTVQGLREDMIRLSNHKDRVEDIHVRVGKLEERILEVERKGNRPPPPKP